MDNKKCTYSTIVFDLGNVLIPFDHSLWIKNYNLIEDGLGDKYFQKFKENNDFNRSYESGKISDDEFIAVHLNWLENKVSRDKFVEIFSNIFSFSNKVSGLLPELKKNYKLVVLSNTSKIHKDDGWGKYDFLENFDCMILSHEVGAYKPEEKIYKAVEEFSKDAPEKHVFIDDMIVNVNAAKSLGWDGIHFTGYENLVEEFKNRNIL